MITSPGGVGWASTQLAKTVPKVRVIGTASENKHAAIRENGIDVTINSKDDSWFRAVRFACPEGVDIAIDVTSGDHFRQTQQLLNHLGRASLIGTCS